MSSHRPLGLLAQLRPQRGETSRSRTYRSSGSPFILIEACSQPGPLAPRALPRFSATMGLSDSRAERPERLCIPAQGLVTWHRSCRASQVPRLIFRRTPSPITPESPMIAHSFLHHRCGLQPIRRLGRSHWSNEAETGSLTLRLTSSPLEASLRRITPPCAQLATCATSNSQGELLSVHEINQAYPGAPNWTKAFRKIRGSPEKSRLTATPLATAGQAPATLLVAGQADAKIR